MLMLPLAEPEVPGSWLSSQLLSDWMLLTLVASEGTTELAEEEEPVDPEEPDEEEPEPDPEVLEELELTVMATLVTQTAPLSPQAFTCSVCAPADALTEAATDVLFTMVVEVLLSSE